MKSRKRIIAFRSMVIPHSNAMRLSRRRGASSIPLVEWLQNGKVLSRRRYGGRRDSLLALFPRARLTQHAGTNPHARYKIPFVRARRQRPQIREGAREQRRRADSRPRGFRRAGGEAGRAQNRAGDARPAGARSNHLRQGERARDRTHSRGSRRGRRKMRRNHAAQMFRRRRCGPAELLPGRL